MEPGPARGGSKVQGPSRPPAVSVTTAAVLPLRGLFHSPSQRDTWYSPQDTATAASRMASPTTVHSFIDSVTRRGGAARQERVVVSEGFRAEAGRGSAARRNMRGS